MGIEECVWQLESLYCDGRLLMVIGECNGNEMSFYGIGSVCTVIGENVMVVLGFRW